MADVLAVALSDELLENIEREYPNQITHVAHGASPLPAPRERHPIFFGCYDWHSAVHSHWALLRLARRDAALAPRIEAALARRITPDAVVKEVAYLAPRKRFELPYGLAWLLLLSAEAAGTPLRTALAPLESMARDRLLGWTRALPAPIRSGEHTSSTFAMALGIEWARAVRDAEAEAALVERAAAFHANDRAAPWHVEPSAYDFLSPGLTTAWLMTRVLGDGFAGWLEGYAPGLGRELVLAPPVAADKSDGKLVHWDGLAFSRAWMLDEIARAISTGDPRVAALRAQADAHGAAGVAALESATYDGLHWLPSFAVYWLTTR